MLLQIVPRLPGTHDGVGDYALNLAQALARQFKIKTIFAVPHATAKEAGAFSVRSFDLSAEAAAEIADDCEDVLLHYVNYGYHVRGVPRRLPGFLQTLRRNSGVRNVGRLPRVVCRGKSALAKRILAETSSDSDRA